MKISSLDGLKGFLIRPSNYRILCKALPSHSPISHSLPLFDTLPTLSVTYFSETIASKLLYWLFRYSNNWIYLYNSALTLESEGLENQIKCSFFCLPPNPWTLQKRCHWNDDFLLTNKQNNNIRFRLQRKLTLLLALKSVDFNDRAELMIWLASMGKSNYYLVMTQSATV